MRIALRTDASRRIGTGHLRRCESLAHALRAEGAELRFVCRAHDEISGIAQGSDVLWLPKPPGYVAKPGDPAHADWLGCAADEDAADTVAALRNFAPDWVLVDHYAIDARWHAHVAQALACRIAVIDDLADRPLAAALVIDQNLHPDHAAKYLPVGGAHARILGGPRYAMLAPAYRDAPRHRFRRTVRSIGIFMGGGDPADFTSRALIACREAAGFDGTIELVSSSRNPRFRHHLELARRWPRTQVLHDEPDLSGFFARHDLQVGSGGIAAWERCCLRAPTLAVQIAANQRAVLPELARAGAVAWLDQDDASAADIGEAVRALVATPRRRLAMVRASAGLVDGWGSARIAAVMAMATKPSLAFRPAQPEDEALLLEWANDPEVRRHAFNARAITSAEHRAWLQKRLANVDACRIFVALSPARFPVGQVRFERADGVWSIGYSLAADFRGLGLARALMSGAIQALRRHDPAAHLEAWVKPDNDASLQTFRALGFTEARADRDGLACHRFEL